MRSISRQFGSDPDPKSGSEKSCWPIPFAMNPKNPCKKVRSHRDFGNGDEKYAALCSHEKNVQKKTVAQVDYALRGVQTKKVDQVRRYENAGLAYDLDG